MRRGVDGKRSAVTHCSPFADLIQNARVGSRRDMIAEGKSSLPDCASISAEKAFYQRRPKAEHLFL